MPCIGGLTTGVLALGYPEILYQVLARPQPSGSAYTGSKHSHLCGERGLLACNAARDAEAPPGAVPNAAHRPGV